MLKYFSDRLLLRSLDVTNNDANLLIDYYKRNREFLKPWEPIREEFYYTPDYQRMIIENHLRNYDLGLEVRLWIFKKNEPDKIIGTMGLSNIVRGPFLSCFLGYKLDVNEIRKGYMEEALRKIIDIAFNEHGLHRIEANIIPRNIPSLELVKKLGFINEGLSPKYLKINGVWEDHIHMVLRNKEME